MGVFTSAYILINRTKINVLNINVSSYQRLTRSTQEYSSGQMNRAFVCHPPLSLIPPYNDEVTE
jgi:hypothetical protein